MSVDPDLGTDRLRWDRRGPVAWCTVDNPARSNALSPAMYRGLGRVIGAVADDPTARALVVTGVDDVFIVGGDIDAHDDGATTDPDDLPFDRLHRGDVPVVAAVNGHCQASGVWLAVMADVAVASDRARFRLPELRLGVAAPWSATLLPGVIGRARAKDLALTGRSVDAAEALAIGLVARVVPHDELAETAQRVALDLLEAAPGARRAWVRAVHDAGPVDHAAVEASIATDEAAEGFAAFVARRPPAWSPAAPSPSPQRTAER